jgi:hypothetical protein
MRLAIAVFSLLVAGSTAVNAQSSIKQTTSAIDTNKDAIYSFDKCSFQIGDLAGGLFGAEDGSGAYTYLQLKKNIDLEAGFYCHAGAGASEVDTLLGAKRVNNEWIWTSSNQPFEKAQHFRIYQLAGKNWIGKGNTYDQTTGDEATRQRFLSFCLVQTDGPQVLCVNTPVMTLNTPSSNMLPKIMTVLKSIKFVDLPTAADASAASGATAHNR